MTNPHIKLATFAFSILENAAAEFRHMLPPYLAEAIDWSTLQHETDTVADPELQADEGDLLFSAHLNGGGVLLLRMLLKSERPPSVDAMGRRLGLHAARQIRHWRKRHPEVNYTPPLIPLIVYFGEEPWNAPRQPQGFSGLLN